ncbi:DUF2842 domain-containing protein [Aurantiacibacter aquimixticola]|uniref:DUF2842 domain-containing protein n=1 Tax=Aurantiacibacter aquimixticola TaxID=1958945 RepID=A0A419RSD8_9SPHN|nr:DUF2842 domain-containing protein [Aurantiacibacter aquimixticola]RJY08712.1 DUF2842 domain-containing protein [Aurantiacibacter aquimixticola]
MRTEPTWRIPVGILGLCAALTVYSILIAIFVPPLIEAWHNIAQMLVYLILGIVWLLPLRNFLIWMETGRWG